MNLNYREEELNIQVAVFWVVTLYSVAVGYQVPPKSWYPTATLHGVTTYNTTTIWRQ